MNNFHYMKRKSNREMILLKQINRIKGIVSGQANNIQSRERKCVCVCECEEVEIVFFLYRNECDESGWMSIRVNVPHIFSVFHSILLSIVIIYLILNGPQNFIHHWFLPIPKPKIDRIWRETHRVSEWVSDRVRERKIITYVSMGIIFVLYGYV